MALIVDPDLLADSAADDNSAEVFIKTSDKTIKLVVVGDLSTDGVTLKALYSFLKEEWRLDPNTKNLPAFAFPMVPITDESFEFVEGWTLLNSTARNLIRTAGWTVRNTSGAVTEQWAGIVGLGSVGGSDQPYYNQGQGRVNFTLTGQVNQAVQVYSDPNGDGNTADGYDRRTSFTVYLREQGKVFAATTIADIGVTSMAPIAYRFPLTTSTDLKVTADDTDIDANSDGTADVAPYSGMDITYYATPQSRSIGGVSYNFGVIIDGNSGTAEQIYEFVQWSLRQSVDIDADASSKIGNVQAGLLQFVGDTLKTTTTINADGGGTGVYIDNYALADINRLVLVDNTGAERTFPRKATLTLQMGANLVADASAKYWVYFTDPDGSPDGDEWGTSGGILVPVDGGGDMTGDVSATASIPLVYDYDGDVTGGRTVGTNVPVVAVAIGLATGQYVRATGTITFPSATIALVAPLERNYANP